MADTFPIVIITPSRVFYRGDVEMVRAPGTIGSFQVLPGHLPLMSTLEIGELDIREPGKDDRAVALSGGFIEVLRDGVNVIAVSAEFADEIDLARAEEAAKRAQERLEAAKGNVDRERAELALQRAMNRLHVAKKAHF